MTASSPADCWRTALRRWAVPTEILRSAAGDPFRIPPELFEPKHQACSEPARRAALEALGDGGDVLDVGCGCGAASVSLGPVAVAVTGVDSDAAMLACFDRQAASCGVAHRSVFGRWPDIAEGVPPHAVVVAHHLVYNVAEIEAFLTALTDHATRAVVMEVTPNHPQAELDDLWWHYHRLARPIGPTVDDLVGVLRSLDVDPVVEHAVRPEAAEPLPRDLVVQFTRARLCLPPGTELELDRRLPQDFTVPPRRVTCLSWAGGARHEG